MNVEREAIDRKLETLKTANIEQLRLLGKMEPALALAECIRREKVERGMAKTALLAKDAHDCMFLMSALYSVIGQIVALNPWLLNDLEAK